MAGNMHLSKARAAKEDEFYTQLADIENELKHYRKHFYNKVVLCNCDDPYESNFFTYFALNFNQLGLRQLICTCYSGSPIEGTQLSFFDVNDSDKLEDAEPKQHPYKIVINEVPDANGDGAIDMADVELLLRRGENVLTELNGDGDFRSNECIALMEQADIVVTNPPFSLFREYVAQLVAYGKKFLIIGNQNAITYKEIFPLLMNDKMWIGYKFGDMAFKVPDSYGPRETRYWQDENGQKWRSMGNVCWYTNLDIPKRHDMLDLFKAYKPGEYPMYENYDAIEVSNVTDIPCDYSGSIGVPITFMDKFNPDQFEILGNSRTLGKPMSLFAEKGEYAQGGMRFYHSRLQDSDIAHGYKYHRCYERLVIRNKHPEKSAE